MLEIGVQVIGLAVLILGMALGEGVLQRRMPLAGAARQARALALMAGVGGLVGACAWWQNLSYAFAWALPPVAARFLAVAAVAFGVTALRAAWIGSVGHLRMIAVMLVVYLGPLAGAAVLLHLDRFDPLAPITYGFFAVVVSMVIAATLALLRLPDGVRGLTSGMLGLVGLLAGLWGLVLFIWPAGPWPLIWPWPQDPLTTRLIAAMFMTVAAACHFAESPGERRTAYILCFIYGVGISLVVTLALWLGKPASLAYLSKPASLAYLMTYLTFWALVAVAALRGLVRERATLSAHAPSHPD